MVTDYQRTGHFYLFGLHGVVVSKGELAIKVVTTWSSIEGPGMFILSEPVNNPQLSME
jgi:hypothetical protein